MQITNRENTKFGKNDEMYKNVSNRPVELVFFDKRLKKSIGLRKPPPGFLRELDDEFDDENTSNKKQ